MSDDTEYDKIKDKLNEKRRRRRLDRHTGIDWIDPENGYGRVRGEQALWRAVILQTLEDAANQSLKPNDQYNRFMAREWLTSESKDFYMVCDLAGFDVGYLRKSIKRALLNNCKWRRESGVKSKKKKKTKHKPKISSTDKHTFSDVVKFPALDDFELKTA